MIRPLRGRVAIRPIVPMRTGLIWHPDNRPDTETAEDKSLGILAQSSHRGRVLGFGAPGLIHGRSHSCGKHCLGHEVPYGFSPGDEVIFVFASGGIERTRYVDWHDGGRCVWVTQEEVIAVVEGFYMVCDECIGRREEKSCTHGVHGGRCSECGQQVDLLHCSPST
jgi:hypothetical protein